jgi:6-phosphogluconolactonase (cycloisomerase 2 family)
LGTDKIHKFDVNAGEPGNYLKLGNPAAFDVAPGSGPRHLDFHPDGKFAYLINELSGAVTAFGYDAAAGNLSFIQSVQADTLDAKGSADMHVSPDGRFLYASNRLKGDGIAIFTINQADGKLTKAGYQETGIHPRNFVITPNGKFLLVAGRDSDVIQIFLIDKTTGLLENTYKDIELDMPVCLKFTSFR